MKKQWEHLAAVQVSCGVTFKLIMLPWEISLTESWWRRLSEYSLLVKLIRDDEDFAAIFEVFSFSSEHCVLLRRFHRRTTQKWTVLLIDSHKENDPDDESYEQTKAHNQDEDAEAFSHAEIRRTTK